MKLSIIVPVFNEEKTVAEILKRIYQAQLPDGCEKEVILINDGSIDNTEEILKKQRYKNLKIGSNGELPAKEIKNYCQIDEESSKLLRQAINTMNLSGRGFHRVLKVARTIADLGESEEIKLEHVAEALQYRQKEE